MLKYRRLNQKGVESRRNRFSCDCTHLTSDLWNNNAAGQLKLEIIRLVIYLVCDNEWKQFNGTKVRCWGSRDCLLRRGKRLNRQINRYARSPDCLSHPQSEPNADCVVSAIKAPRATSILCYRHCFSPRSSEVFTRYFLLIIMLKLN